MKPPTAWHNTWRTDTTTSAYRSLPKDTHPTAPTAQPETVASTPEMSRRVPYPSHHGFDSTTQANCTPTQAASSNPNHT